MLHLKKPEIFTPKFEIVSCFVEYKKEILLLLRQDHKSEPNTYWVPAGKVDKWEKIDDAILREVREETGLKLKDVKYFKKVYVQYPEYEFIYHIYHEELKKKPQIKINLEEHKKHIWRSPEKALEENLIQELDACIKIFYKI